MKIVVLQDLYPPPARGGYPQACRSGVESLVARGHEVVVLTSTRGETDPSSRARVLRRLRCYTSDSLGKRLRGMMSFDLPNRQCLRELLEQEQPDLVMVWNLSRLPDGLREELNHERTPVAYYVHDRWLVQSRRERWEDSWQRQPYRPERRLVKGLVVGFGGKWVLEVLLRKWFRDSPAFPPWHNVAFVSESCRDEYLHAGHKVELAGVIPNGVDLQRFPRRSEFPESATKLLFVGRVEPLKGIDTILRAMASCQQRGIRQQLTVVGPEDHPTYRQELGHLQQELGLDGQVEYLGARTQEQLALTYQSHDVLVFSSVGTERFPLVLLEAMACGLPVVTTLTGGHREYVRHGDNALVYETGDGEDLAKQLERLHREEEVRHRVARGGHQCVTRDYDVERIQDRLERFLRDVVDGARPTV